MAPSPQKASWRRSDTTLIPSDDVGAGGDSSASGQQSSPLTGQDVSSTPDYFPSPSMTLQTSSSRSIAISSSSLFRSPTSSSTISTHPSSAIGFATSSKSLSDALSPTNTQSIFSSFGKPTLTVSSLGPSSFVVSNPLASSGSQSAVITKPFAPPVVQSTLHTLIDTRLPASTPFPVPARIHDGPSLTSTPQIGPSPLSHLGVIHLRTSRIRDFQTCWMSLVPRFQHHLAGSLRG
ncbi:hypothetical protein BGY98DRAFT_428494 [Russula aff. rugulosa BPL654]|nr:hypothetical protein BGY98DRAFT_428494 [Russula aff. rugulosa BPL654]